MAQNFTSVAGRAALLLAAEAAAFSSAWLVASPAGETALSTRLCTVDFSTLVALVERR